MSTRNMKKALAKAEPKQVTMAAMLRTVQKHASLAQDYGGYSDYTPSLYSGKPFSCAVCDKVHPVKANWMNHPCECASPVLETKEAAMERRAHWLLKKEFAPPELINWPGTVDHSVLHEIRDSYLSDRKDVYTQAVDAIRKQIDTDTIKHMMGDIVHGEPKAPPAVRVPTNKGGSDSGT